MQALGCTTTIYLDILSNGFKVVGDTNALMQDVAAPNEQKLLL